MLMLSISRTEAIPTPQAAHLVIRPYSDSRLSIGRFLGSSIPRGNLSRSRITAAATTGPASGAQPASSTPASGCGKSISSLKEQRRGIRPLFVIPAKAGTQILFLFPLDPPFRGTTTQGSIRQGGNRRDSPAL